MRLAVQDSWPNKPETAEREFIARFKIACAAVGVECESVITSDDILRCAPDAVLVSHEYSRKLTGAPTIGMVWSPLSFFKDDPYRVRSLLSFDGYLVANREIATYLRDLQFGVGVRKPVAAETFLPTTYRTDVHALERGGEPSLCYVGVHWDGARHGEVFEVLARRGLVTCYGPEASWRRTPEAYGGPLPFDGRSVVEAIARHGVVLCLHKAEHRRENTPSMRIFEALSVGALPICDDVAFAREHLSDVVAFVDAEQPADALADQIEAVLDDVRRRPDEARERARRGKAWFDLHWSLESKITDLIVPFVEEVARAGFFKRAQPARASAPERVRWTAPAAKPLQCEVIIRCGGREMRWLERAIGSVRAANAPDFPLGVILVDYKGRPDIEALASASSADLPIRYMRSAATGFRSTALWDGLRAAKAPFVAHLDDDDSVFENHYRQLSATFAAGPEADVCYSGVVRVEDEEGFYVDAPNYEGPLAQVIEERRELKFLDAFDVVRLARFDNYIQSNAWMGRTAFVQSVMGEDPELLVIEDVYLYLLMASRGAFGFSGSPTAVWHWRSRSADNSMLAVEQAEWQRCGHRIEFRLARVPFKSTLTYERLVSRGSLDAGSALVGRLAPPPALGFDQVIEGGAALRSKTILTGFHAPESAGVRPREPVADVLFALDERVPDEGGVLLVEWRGSSGGPRDRTLELSIKDGARRRIAVSDDVAQTVELPLPAGTASPVLLQLTSSPGGSARGGAQQGDVGLLRSLRILPEADARVSPIRVAELGLPEAWTASLTDGMARGALTTRKRVAMRVRASAGGGRLFMGGDTRLSVARSDDGDFFVPGRVAQAAHWFVFLSTDPAADGEVRLEFTDAAGDTVWLTLDAQAEVILRDHLSLNDGQYQHAAASLTGSRRRSATAPALYLLIQNHDGVGWWETRPAYGAAWAALGALGEAASDDHGPYRRGPLAALAARVAPNGRSATATPVEGAEAVGAAIMRSVLVGAVAELAAERPPVPAAFLRWLIDQLLVEAPPSLA